MSWRTKRKLLYTSAALLPLILIIGTVYYSTFFPQATCFDGEMNQDEQGVDCGGTCSRICQVQTPNASIQWDRAFNVSDDVYNLAAYIQNPNVTLTARDVPYSFKLYDTENLLIADRRGTVDIPAQPATVVVEPGVSTNERRVSRTTFEFLESPFWQQSGPSANFQITNKFLSNPTSSRPQLTLDVTNDTQRDFQNVELTPIVFSDNGQAIQVSQTFIESIPAEDTRSAVFTWRRSFEEAARECTQPLSAAFIIDTALTQNASPQVENASSTSSSTLESSSSTSGLLQPENASTSSESDFSRDPELAQDAVADFLAAFDEADTLDVYAINSTASTSGTVLAQATSTDAAAALSREISFEQTTASPSPDRIQNAINRASSELNAYTQPKVIFILSNNITEKTQSLPIGVPPSNAPAVYGVSLIGSVDEQNITPYISDIISVSSDSFTDDVQDIRERYCEDSQSYITEIIPTDYEAVR